MVIHMVVAILKYNCRIFLSNPITFIDEAARCVVNAVSHILYKQLPIFLPSSAISTLMHYSEGQISDTD